MRLKLKRRFKYKNIGFIFIIIISYILLYLNTNIKYIFINNISVDKYIFKKISKITIKESSNDKDYVVYIYNTHQTEEYNSDNLSYSVTPTVYYASFILKEHLNDLGINSYVETSSIKEYLNNNNLGYRGCYEASRYYMKERINEYNSFIYYIDLHRDSVKNTSVTINNIKYAKVMFVVTTKHNNYKSNLEFVESLNNKLDTNYKGLSRGIYKRNDVIFNQDISSKAILIELGGINNTLEEINNTLEVIANVISEDYYGK